MTTGDRGDDSHDHLSDAALVGRLIDGDRAALAELYTMHRRSVMLYALSMLSSRPDAEEVLQDAFLTLWTKRATFAADRISVLPWLLVTARNLALNRRRHLQRRATSELDDRARSTDGDPEGSAVQSELRRELEAAVATLPEVDRRLVELCLVHGLSYREAAAQLQVSEPVVRNRLSRLRLRLRAALAMNAGDA